MVQIYSDFSSDISWISERIREETSALPDSLRSLAEYYLEKRPVFLPDRDRLSEIDRDLSRPTPYAVFWFADEFGLADREIARKLALGLVHSRMAFAVLDYIIDQESQSTSHSVALAGLYLHRYFTTFDDLFDPYSKFWHCLASYTENFMQYLYRDFTVKHEHCNMLKLDPFSESFLKESSKSYSALVETILAALAFLTNNETRIPIVNKFCEDYALAHRIHDDLNDWQEDLRTDNLNHSSVLTYALQKIGGKLRLTEELVRSMFLDTDFIEKIYGAILGFLEAAREDVSAFSSAYLSSFIDGQISFHTRRRGILLRTSSDFYKELARILNK